MRKTEFKIETYGNASFEGYTLEEDWNGWSCPYFTLEESKRIVNAHTATGQNASYNENSDTFCFESQDEEEFYTPLELKGMKLYPIGNSSWIWEEKGE